MTEWVVPSINSSCMRSANCRCLRYLLLVMCMHPLAKKGAYASFGAQRRFTSAILAVI